MISTNLKLLLISICALVLAACEASRPPFTIDNEKYGALVDRKAASPGVLIAKRAIDIYETQYLLAQNHKAIAQARNGTWSWTHDQATLEAAMDAALAQCQQRNQSSEDSTPCQLVNINGFWVADFARK